MRKLLVLILCAGCFMSSKAQAEPAPTLELRMNELTQMVKELKGVVEQQQQEINLLRQSKEGPLASPALEPSATFPRYGTKVLPEIGAVADVALRLDSPKTDEEGADRVQVREVELVLGGNVDPYSRLDSTVAFTEESTAELEEAYLTRFELPFDVTARIGRFKPKIGKVLPVHRDSLDTVDDPLVIQHYFGAEGMSKSGVDFTKLLDLPLPTVHQVMLGVLEGGNGEGGTAFGEIKRRPTIYGHLKNYLDISDATNLEIGLSDAIGSRDADASFEINVFGLDATLIHQLNANQTLKFQGELFNIDRSESFIDITDDITDDITGDVTQQDIDGNVWGGYGLADFRMSSQWATGFRFDYVEHVDNPLENPDKAEIGYTGYLTFYQSEFARWRVQLSHVDLVTGEDDNRVFLQGTFAIGEHKHKLQ